MLPLASRRRAPLALALSAAAFGALPSAEAAVPMGVTLVGDATRVYQQGQLTPPQPYMTGAAWLSTRVDITRHWRAHFEFSLTAAPGTGEGLQGDGVAFVVQDEGRFALGNGGGGLGFMGLTSVASVIQTYANNRVGITTTGNPYDAPSFPIELGYCFSITGDETVTYRPVGHVLEMTGSLTCDGVTYDFSDSAVVNLRNAMGKPTATIGLTSGSGTSFADQRIGNFQFGYLDGNP